MEAAVPFALLASVQVVSFAAALGLAAAAATLAYRRAARVLLATGALLLAASHSLVGADLGSGRSTALALLRVGGYALVAGGLSGLRTVELATPLVVVPLAAPPQVAALATAAAAFAATAAARLRRPGSRLLLVAFALAAAAEGLTALGDRRSGVAIAVLVLRGASSAALIGFLAVAAQARLLSKVVGAILAGVLALAVGTSIVVGTVATRSLAQDLSGNLRRVAAGQADAIEGLTEEATTLAESLAILCPAQPGCEQPIFRLSADPRPFSLHVLPNRRIGARAKRNLTDIEASTLAQSPALNDALRQDPRTVSTLYVLLGGEPKLAVVAAAPADGKLDGTPYDGVYVYGSVVGAERLARFRGQSAFDSTIFVGSDVIASNLPAGDSVLARIGREYEDRDVLAAVRAGREVTVEPEGERPAIRFTGLENSRGDVVAVLAVSAESRTVLTTQRAVLRALFLGTLFVALLVGLLAFSLGRRVVRPVHELTLAASRVRSGDLSARTAVRSRDELGVLARTFDAMTDSLTESRAGLVAAAEQEAGLRARLQAILDSMGDGLVTTDAAGVVTDANPAATAILGPGVVGRPVTDVLGGVDVAGGPLLPDLRAGTRVGTLRRDGAPFVPVALAVTPLSTGGGHVVVVRDTTREREIERMKTEFLSNVSHELRTPLTPIRGYAELLARKADLPPDRSRQYAGTILDASVRMTRVVDLLVDVAALEAGRVVPSYARVEVGDFVDERLDVWRRRAPGREFRRRLAARLPAVHVDRHWLAKAVDELVDNAVKFSAGPVTFAAALAPDGERVRLTVRDLGVGIPADRLGSLFTPFEQLDGSATREVGGLGLGLSFVRRVADDFGLEVTVESVEGKGSSFSLDLPVAPAVPAPRSSGGSARARRSA